MTLEHKIDIDWYIWFEEKQQVDQKTVNMRLIHKKVQEPKNMLLMKNPQFLSNLAQNLRDWPNNFCGHLTKFELNRMKIVDFLVIAQF